MRKNIMSLLITSTLQTRSTGHTKTGNCGTCWGRSDSGAAQCLVLKLCVVKKYWQKKDLQFTKFGYMI